MLHSNNLGNAIPNGREMLRLIRALGFLAPLPVVLLAMVGFTVTVVADSHQRLTFSALTILAGAAGAGVVALTCWIYFGIRLGHVADVLEATLNGEQPLPLRVAGTQTEKRLAKALNAASGAFVLV
jgi:hypothetical protein